MRRASENKALAKQHMKGKWGTAIVIFLLYWIISAALSFTGIGTIIVMPPLLIGIILWFILVSRKKEAEISTLFKPFSTCFVTSILSYLLQTIYILLWSLLLIIPGIIKSFSYAMANYLIANNPKIGPNEAITKSRELMNGHKWRLFCLMFSFIGWHILAMLTFGILYIYVLPYLQAAEVEFFEEIAAKAGVIEGAMSVDGEVLQTAE